MQFNVLNWGILGTSPISEQMVSAINNSQKGSVYGVASRQVKKAEDFAKKFDIPQCYSHAEELLLDDNIDVVYIGLPNHLHLEWANKALEAGKHALCEKPLVRNEQEALRLIDSAKSSGLFCMEAIMYRCHPLTQRIKAIVDSGCLGSIQMYNAVYTANIEHVANPNSGGAIYNLGCYPMSLIQYLTGGEPLDMVALGVANDRHPANDSFAAVTMRFSDDVLANITTSDSVAMHWSFEVIGTKGRLISISNPWMPQIGEQTLHLSTESCVEPECITVQSTTCVYTHQIDTVNQHILFPNTLSEARISLQESLSCVRSLERWREIALSHQTIAV